VEYLSAFYWDTGDVCANVLLLTDVHKLSLFFSLEADIKRLKADLQASRNSEAELRAQIANKTNEDRIQKATLAQVQQDNDNLQNKSVLVNYCCG